MARLLRPSENTFTGTGIIGRTKINVRKQNSLSVVVEGVGVTNSITVRGKIDGETDFETIGSALVGEQLTIQTFDVSDYDLIQFDCTVYDAVTSGQIYASVFK